MIQRDVRMGSMVSVPTGLVTSFGLSGEIQYVPKYGFFSEGKM